MSQIERHISIARHLPSLFYFGWKLWFIYRCQYEQRIIVKIYYKNNERIPETAVLAQLNHQTFRPEIGEERFVDGCTSYVCLSTRKYRRSIPKASKLTSFLRPGVIFRHPTSDILQNNPI